MNPLKGTVRGFFSTENSLEIVPDGVSKGVAVKWLCEYLDIPLENSVAAGDAPNDVEMLQAACVGAVMKNAYEGMDRYATYVTERDNNHDGSGGNYREVYFKIKRRSKTPGVLNTGSFCSV